MSLDDRPDTRGERANYHAIATVDRIARVLPTRTGRVVFAWLGSVAYHAFGKIRRVVAANQARVLGRAVDDPLVMASTKEAFRLYGRYWFDTFHIETWSDRQILETFAVEGLETLQEPVKAGIGVIVAMPHTGNWDAAGRVVVANDLPVVAVAEELRPRELFDLFVRTRQRSGLRIIGHEQGRVGQRLVAELAGGNVVALVADRDLSGRGIEVQMFGATRRLPAGPAMLAMSSGAPIVIADVNQTATGWRVAFRRLPDVPRTGDRRADATAITEQIARGFERGISARPEDWHMFQPAWED